MAIKYPWLPAIGILILAALIFLCLFLPGRRGTYSGGLRVANTHFVKSLPEYRKLFLQRRILRIALIASLSASVIGGLFLASRPFSVQKVTNGVQRRDIFLCLDVSYSLYALNYGLADYLENIVTELQGDRFGILMFNTSSVVYVPMTDDYDYVVQRLEELKGYFAMQKEYEERFEKYDYVSEMSEEEYQDYTELTKKLRYFETGTLMNNMQRGSSLIGEGLASCLYSFPSIGDSERTRIIIMATDNADSAFGQETPKLPEACALCKKNKVTVFSIFPDERNYYPDYSKSEYAAFLEELTDSVKTTGGECYVESAEHTVGRIVESIRHHKAMTVDELVTEKPLDMPKVPFLILFVSLSVAGLCGIALKY
ncbi:MAG: hypothetical protein K6F53_11700 [Lachnospiraceae bacterium]|nr:hypothetical protein [Lachnospiraceae bacterium]